MNDQVPLRIVLTDPPAGVPWAVQLGRDGLLPPRSAGPSAVVFEFTLTLGPPAADGSPTFRGPAAQGPPAKRFVYVNSGWRAGDPTSSWDRRAKVPLGGITADLVAAVRRATAGGDGDGVALEARIAGTHRRGGPACATVPLLDGGWRVRPSHSTV